MKNSNNKINEQMLLVINFGLDKSQVDLKQQFNQICQVNLKQ